jgi:chitin synthase
LSLFLFFGSFFLAAIMHPQEFGCLPYLVIYYITIPAMYLLLVIYSIFNLHVVSWGTREVPKKKTKQELEEEKKKEEELKKAAKKQSKKKDGGLIDMLMRQKGDPEQKGGLEFSVANLVKCMCFTHDDPNDNSKQLVKIAASVDEVSHRLQKIESMNRPYLQHIWGKL